MLQCMQSTAETNHIISCWSASHFVGYLTTGMDKATPVRTVVKVVLAKQCTNKERKAVRAMPGFKPWTFSFLGRCAADCTAWDGASFPWAARLMGTLIDTCLSTLQRREGGLVLRGVVGGAPPQKGGGSWLDGQCQLHTWLSWLTSTVSTWPGGSTRLSVFVRRLQRLKSSVFPFLFFALLSAPEMVILS